MILSGKDSNLLLKITDNEPVNNCKPSVDVLFESVAELSGSETLAVVMTGMGRDGTAGVLKLKKKGAYTIVQDKDSSVVWGMPRSVIEAGAADEVVPLEQIGDRINKIVLQT